MLNISSLRTPGVYIDEVPKFPPSIAAVETAIPAFIGYTAKTEFNGNIFLNKAIEVESMVDFEEKFGGAPPIDVSSVILEIDNSVRSATVNSCYYLYDSMRMYFANGGGRCYVVTIGEYPTTLIPADLQSGISDAIDVVELEDEPTLFVFPDGIKLTPTNLGILHAKALAQCEKYKDRFLIADVIISNPANDRYDSADISNFKTAIGMGNLQFAGAYYPYLKVSLPREVNYRDIAGKVNKLGVPVNWASDFVDPLDTETLDLLADLDQILLDRIVINNVGVTNPGDFLELEEQYQILKLNFQTAVATFRATVNTANRDAVRDDAETLLNFLYAIAHAFMDQLAKEVGSLIDDPLLSELRNRLDNDVLSNYIVPLANADALMQTSTILTASLGTAIQTDGGGRTWDYTGANNWVGAITAPPAPDVSSYIDVSAQAAGDPRRIASVDNLEALINSDADNIFYGLYVAIGKMYEDAKTLEATNEVAVLRRIPVMAGVIGYLKGQNFLLPPSGAIAGVYARVDGNRGVWKAPANESLRNVVAPSVKLSQDQHGLLNVDPSFGKSINAVRHFTGKGNLVFGARTLAGNDNEWRYVSVRRFFNMVEESSKKATEQFVFEPNDENTWVRVQAMIENFLTTLWRQGALQGSTTEQAFYVQVGLGKTMTALDILEGRMIVEIGMAVVRPAEFIILRFSHKLPEA